MTQKEEIYAREFYQELKNKFWGKQNPISKFLGLKANEPKSNFAIALKEAGTQSECIITKETRQCSIHCFANDWNDLKHKGPEFYTTYMENGKPIANGRTFDKLETVDAIKYWLQNKTLDELYSKFKFIDEKKRQLDRLRADINKLSPQLATISQNAVVEESFSSYNLWFSDDNRSCRIYYYGYEPNPRYIFKWDDCIIFETSSSDIKRLGTLINKWVVDKAMPSTLKVEFPEIDFGKLAEYYEKGNGIEGEFILSWDNIENFYRELELDKKPEILHLIKQMREKGFERTLRAGQSLYTFILSRSRRHGLRENQDSISFSFNYIKSAMEVQTRKGQKMAFDKIEYNDTIENLLKTIELESID
ncbi:MAG: hypothetical protein V4608_11810 [Bacteroidota bacterium]